MYKIINVTDRAGKVKEEFMNDIIKDENYKQKALIIAVLDEENELNPNYNFEDDIQELKNLCDSCDIEVIEVVTQKLKQINQKTYVGSGKIDYKFIIICFSFILLI